MDVETKAVIDKLIKSQEETKELVKKVYRLNKINLYTKFAYWLFLILVALGAFYFIKPVLGSLINVYTGGEGQESGMSSNFLKTLSGSGHIDDFLNQTIKN